MTILRDAREGLAALLDDALTGVQVRAFPCGENSASEECVHFEKWRSRFEWRSLGNDPKNRSEEIEIDIVVHVYKQSGSQVTSGEQATARCEDLLEDIEAAVVASGPGSFTVGGRFTFSLVSAWDVVPVPREKGWSCEARATFTGTHYPA